MKQRVGKDEGVGTRFGLVAGEEGQNASLREVWSNSRDLSVEQPCVIIDFQTSAGDTKRNISCTFLATLSFSNLARLLSLYNLWNRSCISVYNLSHR